MADRGIGDEDGVRPLSSLRVLDLSQGIAGAYAGKLLCDAGAEVLKVEGPGGDPMRGLSASGRSLDAAGDGVLFRFLHTSKRSIRLDRTESEGRGRLLELFEQADVVLESEPPGTLDRQRLGFDALRERNPRAVLVSITPFGRSGPYRDRPANEFTLQAWSGSTASHGRAGREPLQAGGGLGDWLGGLYSAIGVLGALRVVGSTGVGLHVDLSLLDAMIPTFTNVAHSWASFTGIWDVPPADEIPGIEPTRDGFVGFCVFTGQQWKDFCLLIERPDLGERPELDTMMGRLQQADELREIVHDYMRRHTTEEILERAELLRIPVAPIGHGASLPELDHLRARGVFVPNPRGGFAQPRVPYRSSAWTPRPFEPAPRLDEHRGAPLFGVRSAERGGAPSGAAEEAACPERPLAGLRVLDMTAFWAGPWGGQILSLLGAEVIHVESVQRPDGMRFGSSRMPAEPDWWEFGPTFAASNLGKKGLTLDLTRPEGVALLLRLVERSDVLVENFSARVMDQFGLDWERLSARNPRLVFVRMPAFGLDGPWRDRVGFAQTMEQLSGMAWSTGYADGSDEERLPMNARGPTDPQAGLHAVFCALLGLAQREKTGRGAFIESPFVETALNLTAEMVGEYATTKHLMERSGNRSPYFAPQGVYRCRVEPGGDALAGEDRVPYGPDWMALSIETESQWGALLDLLGDPGLADLDSPTRRLAEHDRIDAVIRAWAASRSVDSAVAALSDRGIPAAIVTPWRRAAEDPHVRARGLFQTLDHPLAGRHDYAGLPLRFGRDTPHPIPAASPTLGQHNDEVLRGLLGLSEAELGRLREARIIGDQPVWG